MKIFRIAENEELYIDAEEMDDRVRIYLKRKDGQQNEFGEDYVGKLTVQHNYYGSGDSVVTSFRIDPEYRAKGWGRKMMEKAFEFQKNNYYVRPSPFGGLDDRDPFASTDSSLNSFSSLASI